VGETGLYTWRVGGERVGREAVNFPPQESDLRADDPGRFVLDARVFGSGGELRAAREGRALWPHCLGGLSLFVVLEGLVTVWAGRT